MQLKKKYTTLEEVLFYIKIQAIESIPFAEQFLPSSVVSINEIFNFLKKETIYKNDPPNVELLQSMKTLFSITENKHGIYGCGDCDCFTIAALASLYARGYYHLSIVLAGRNVENPSHIYVKVNSTPFDLTCSRLGEVRRYPYKQIIPVNLRVSENNLLLPYYSQKK